MNAGQSGYKSISFNASFCFRLHSDKQIIRQLKWPLSYFKTTVMMNDQKVIQFTNTENMHFKIKNKCMFHLPILALFLILK